VAFALHALVDYPFARLGTCGWYFALAGMLAAQQSGSTYERRHKRSDAREVAPAEFPELASLT
jgi:hypothetical protein